MVCKCEAGAEPDENGEDRYVFLVAECGLIPKGGNAGEIFYFIYTPEHFTI